jgi:hypothetical protein
VQKLIKGNHVSPYKFLPRSPASKSGSPEAEATSDGTTTSSGTSPEDGAGVRGMQYTPPTNSMDSSYAAYSANPYYGGADEGMGRINAYASDDQFLNSIDYESDEYDQHRPHEYGCVSFRLVSFRLV